MSTAKNKKPKIESSVTFAGDKAHAMEKLFEGKELPTIKSVGIARVPDTNKYVSFTLHTKGNEVVKFEVEEPDFKGIAEETAKIAFVGTFLDSEQ